MKVRGTVRRQQHFNKGLDMRTCYLRIERVEHLNWWEWKLDLHKSCLSFEVVPRCIFAKREGFHQDICGLHDT